LRSFQVTTVIYDGTVSFCERFVSLRSRTHDQMVQAARSGRQNIAEGSRAAAVSSQTELRLVSVARASLDELVLDYEDYLRQHHLRQWDKDDPEAREVRGVGRQRPGNDTADPVAHWQIYMPWLENADPGVVANTLICLIHQANYLLDQQIGGLERDFVQGGGYTEQLATERIKHRKRQKNDPNQTTSSDSSSPDCSLCGEPMVLRTAKMGKNAGSQFWGCSAYPACKGTLSLDGE
jgi:restriction system protein